MLYVDVQMSRVELSARPQPFGFLSLGISQISSRLGKRLRTSTADATVVRSTAKTWAMLNEPA